VLSSWHDDWRKKFGHPLFDLVSNPVNRKRLPHEPPCLLESDRLWEFHASCTLLGASAKLGQTTQSLDRVLDIFIRVNSQGLTLTKSDLLMSVATAQWQERDAREEIPGTLRHVNGIHPGFGFSRDHVLKAGLVLAGISDFGFRADTFNRENMRRLEAAWPTISQRLYLAVDLLASFGLSRNNIDAGMILIPVAYYVHRRQLDDRYLASTSTAADRQRVRDWTIRSLLMPGIFGSGLDTLLAAFAELLTTMARTASPPRRSRTSWQR
jgi:hypothetical protein